MLLPRPAVCRSPVALALSRDRARGPQNQFDPARLFQGSACFPAQCCQSCNSKFDLVYDLLDLEYGFMGSSIADRPMCPVCKHRMALGRVSPGERGFEDRTFECSTGERTERVSEAVDPMKTDAVGWLASELRHPR
jgi:hypothetical protein